MGRICDSFNCLPSQALWELENDPYRFAPTIVLLRDYAAAKRSIDAHAKNPDKVKLPDDPMIDLIQEIDFELEFGIARVAEEKAWEAEQQGG